MRTTCEIVADLKDGNDPTYEELKMACLVQSSLLFLYQQDTKSLLKGGIGADLVKSMNYKDKKTSSVKGGIPSWYWNGIKKDPYDRKCGGGLIAGIREDSGRDKGTDRKAQK